MGWIFLPFKCLFLLTLYKKGTFSNHSFGRWVWNSLNFIHPSSLDCLYYGKFVLNPPKLHWTNIFIFEILIFSNFIEKVIFDQSQFQRVDVTLAEFSSIQFSSLWVEREVVSKHKKFRWTNILSIEVFIFTNLVQNFEWSQFQKVGVEFTEFY